MKKSILNLGKQLKKIEQKTINGGVTQCMAKLGLTSTSFCGVGGECPGISTCNKYNRCVC